MTTTSEDHLVHSVVNKTGREVVGYSSTDALNRLWWLVNEWEVRSVIEVGSYVGMTAVFLAENTPVGPIVCVDTFDAKNRETMNPVGVHDVDDQYTEFLINTLPYVNIRHIVLPSIEAAKLDFTADMVYIDAGHTYEDVTADIEAWTPHARKVVCGDDNLDPRFGVTNAVRDLDIPNRKERVWWQIVS